MTFNDDDLKRLKVHLETDKEFHENATWVEHVKMDALLSRLEAAEVCARHLEDFEPKCELLEPWRKAAGR